MNTLNSLFILGKQLLPKIKNELGVYFKLRAYEIRSALFINVPQQLITILINTIFHFYCFLIFMAYHTFTLGDVYRNTVYHLSDKQLCI
jgi:hypothetical protein